MAAKQVVGTVQALGIIDHTCLCKLDEHVTPDDYAQGFWQWQEQTHVPIRFWS